MTKFKTALGKTVFLPIAILVFIVQYYRGTKPKQFNGRTVTNPEPKIETVSMLKKPQVQKGVRATWH